MIADAGVADHHVEPAERLDRRGDESIGVGFDGDVGGDRDRPAAAAADGGDQIVEEVFAPRRDDDGAAFGGDTFGGGAADAGRRASDRDDASVEPAHFEMIMHA